ncbi:MAG: amino acid adenylation domain-containing protein [Actinocatenispora sp.]
MAVDGAGSDFRRPVSPVEWWLVGHPPAATPIIQLVVEGAGRIGPDALAAAVATAGAACPGTRLVRRGHTWVDSGRPVPVRTVPAGSAELLELPALHGTLSGRRRPPCEVLLVDGAASTVVFRTSHEVMDGSGLLLWVGEVFRALRGETPVDAADPTSEGDVLADIPTDAARSTPELRHPALLGARDRAATPRFRWHRRTVDGYHPALVARTAQVVTAWSGADDGRFSVPVDLRRHVPGVRSTANLSQSVPLDVPAGQSWVDIQERLLEMLAERRELETRTDPAFLKVPPPLLRFLNGRADAKAAGTDRYPATAALSHLGRLDIADFHTGSFEATAVYPLSTLPLCGPAEFNMLECGGHTEITLAWHDGDPAAARRAEELLDRLVEALSPRERRDWDGNRTSRPTPDTTLPRMFAEQVARTPDAVAVSAPDGEFTYAELARRSAAVAAALGAHGVGRDDRVGLVGGRTAASIVAIWGILRAGAGYLPIDEQYPDERITGLLADAKAPVCLLGAADAARDCLPDGCRTVRLDTLPDDAPDWSDVDGAPTDLANVIYTSGSTGRPKGVEIEHRSLVNYVRWVTREARLDADTRMPLIASISFDMAGCAVFLPLLNGGTVLPVPDVNAVTLRDVLQDAGANTLAITPSHLDLINQLSLTGTSMRVVMTAGELLRRSTAVRAKELFGPDCRILCQWGPSETTIVNTSHEFDADSDTDAGVPFGRPMDNNTVYLLDPHGCFVEPGEPGEAYVGGAQVARGYLDRPALTRERFVRLADGTPVYRTGDITRLLPTGDLAFVGRVDDQVKVLGHRIEPAEVAQALEAHPAVKQAAVVARNRPGQQHKELCAYVVSEDEVTPVELSGHLATLLPRYMVPAAIMTIDAIPRTPNGKTDARALPDPFAERAGTEDVLAADRDDLGAAVARIWVQTLRVDPAVLDDHTDFHQLGGNSLLLLSMISEVSTAVVGGPGQEAFMRELGRIIREPTLGGVTRIAREVRAKHPAPQA